MGIGHYQRFNHVEQQTEIKCEISIIKMRQTQRRRQY